MIDDAYTPFSESIAHQLSVLTGAKMSVLGLEDRTAGFYCDNLPPTVEKIMEAI